MKQVLFLILGFFLCLAGAPIQAQELVEELTQPQGPDDHGHEIKTAIEVLPETDENGCTSKLVQAAIHPEATDQDLWSSSGTARIEFRQNGAPPHTFTKDTVVVFCEKNEETGLTGQVGPVFDITFLPVEGEGPISEVGPWHFDLQASRLEGRAPKLIYQKNEKGWQMMSTFYFGAYPWLDAWITKPTSAGGKFVVADDHRTSAFLAIISN